VLSGKPSGSHQIEGIGIGFIPPLWEPDQVDEIITVTTSDAKEMARRLARKEGIFTGTSRSATANTPSLNASIRAVHCTGFFVGPLIVSPQERVFSNSA